MTGQPRRWVAAGSSRALDPACAAREAVTAALAGNDPESAKLLLVFCSAHHDLDRLLREVERASGGVEMVGCSTAGEITAGGASDLGLVVFALGGEGFSVRTAIARDAYGDPRGAGVSVARQLDGCDDRSHRVVLMLTDALAGDQQDIVRGAFSVLGSTVPLVGGCTGDDLKMVATSQFHNGTVHRDCVVAAWIGSDAPLGIGVRHGWKPVGSPILVTRSRGNRVYELGGEPALDVYLDRLDAPPDARTDPDAFTRFALRHPLGILRRSGEPHARLISWADFDTRALVSVAAVTEGASVWLMHGDEQSILDATDAACAEAVSTLVDSPPIGMVVFDCNGRRSLLGREGSDTEITRISRFGRDAPLAGFYTYGEFARIYGVDGFHNEALVVMAVG